MEDNQSGVGVTGFYLVGGGLVSCFSLDSSLHGIPSV